MADDMRDVELHCAVCRRDFTAHDVAPTVTEAECPLCGRVVWIPPPAEDRATPREGLLDVLTAADGALAEAEAVLGGEYGDFYGVLIEKILGFRRKLAALRAPAEAPQERQALERASAILGDFDRDLGDRVDAAYSVIEAAIRASMERSSQSAEAPPAATEQRLPWTWHDASVSLPGPCETVLTMHREDLWPVAGYYVVDDDGARVWLREVEGPEDVTEGRGGVHEPLYRAPTHWARLEAIWDAMNRQRPALSAPKGEE